MNGDIKASHLIDCAQGDQSAQFMGEGAGGIPSPFAGGGEGLTGESVPTDNI